MMENLAFYGKTYEIVGKAWLVFAITGIDAIFTVGVLMGEVKHLPNDDILFLPYVSDDNLVLHACYEGVDDVGVGNLLQLVLALGEGPDVAT
jgi:hypothetical protein